MSDEKRIYERVALITEIAKRQPNIGRTALMKYLYLLQEVKGIDLGYRFELYSYGPFDGAVLSDITTSVNWGATKQTICHYPSGTGYELSPGENAAQVHGLSGGFVAKIEPALEWAISHFKKYGAGDMELVATMVYVDQEAKSAGETLAEDELIDRALKIKPRYSKDQAKAKLETLRSAEALVASMQTAS